MTTKKDSSEKLAENNKENIGFRLTTTPDALDRVQKLMDISGLDRNTVVTSLIIHATTACAQGLSEVLIEQAVKQHEQRVAALRKMEEPESVPMFPEVIEQS